MSALNDISKHDKEQAQTVVDAGAITLLSKLISNEDLKLKVTQDYLFVFIRMLRLKFDKT